MSPIARVVVCALAGGTIVAGAFGYVDGEFRALTALLCVFIMAYPGPPRGT